MKSHAGSPVLHAETSCISHAKEFLLYFTWSLIVTLLRVKDKALCIQVQLWLYSRKWKHKMCVATLCEKARSAQFISNGDSIEQSSKGNGYACFNFWYLLDPSISWGTLRPRGGRGHITPGRYAYVTTLHIATFHYNPDFANGKS